MLHTSVFILYAISSFWDQGSVKIIDLEPGCPTFIICCHKASFLWHFSYCLFGAKIAKAHLQYNHLYQSEFRIILFHCKELTSVRMNNLFCLRYQPHWLYIYHCTLTRAIQSKENTLEITWIYFNVNSSEVHNRIKYIWHFHELDLW